jgi:hypothetical protein
MRCTRCDGLAVPQAVGVAPNGTVVFGWCLQCLADTNCRLVEIPSAGLWDLRLSFVIDKPKRFAPLEGSSSPAAVDESRWILAIVAFLMVGCGLILLTAGLFTVSQPPIGSNSLGNGSPALLGVGGGATALLGLGILVLASYRDWLPGAFMLGLLSWLSFVIGLGILAQGIFDYQPRRNVPLVLGSGAALAISVAALLLARSQKRKAQTIPHSAPWKTSSEFGWSNAGGNSRLH